MEQKNAIILCRVSTENQENQWESLENQMKLCEEHCKKNNYNVVSRISETMSGKSSDRVAINAIKKFIKWYDRQIDYLVFLKLDRFWRMSNGEYENIKKDFFKLWTRLQDVYGFIQEEKQVVKVAGLDFDEYGWNKDSQTAIAETFQVLAGNQERKTILQRTIPREAELAMQGYTVGPVPYGYKNSKTQDIKKLSILEPDELEAPCIKKIFELRTQSKTDIEIEETIYNLWYRTRNRSDGSGNKKITVKKIQEFVKNIKYAGIVKWKWTAYRAIELKWTPILSIKLFNKANKWAIAIVPSKTKDEVYWLRLYDILYNVRVDGNWTSTNPAKKKTRNIENDNFKYTKLVYSPYWQKLMSWSISKWRKWDASPNYHATIPFKKPELFREWYELPKTTAKKGYYFWVRRELFEKRIIDFVSTLHPHKDFIEVYIAYLEKVWNSKWVELTEIEVNWETKIKLLKNEAQKIVDNINKVVDFAEILKAQNNKLTEINNDIQRIEQELKNNPKNSQKPITFSEFKKNCIFLLEHIKDCLINAETYQERKFIFDIIFTRTPYYDEIVVGTQILSPLWLYIKQNSQNESESFTWNLEWLPK